LEEIKLLISGCLKGKADYQTKFYRMFSKKMFGVCLLYTKDRTEAEDILQEGFVKVFQNLSSFKHECSPEFWMRRIFINTALERFRKQRIMYASNEFDACDDLTSDFTVANEINAKELMDMVHELSPQYRLVFNLYAIEGYAHKEIAEMLDINEGTSKSNLARARKILQNMVNKYFDSMRKVV